MNDQRSSGIQDEIAIRLWDGDETVLAEILVQYAPCLEKSLAGKYTSFSMEDLEDIVCEAIKRLWATRERYDDSKGSIRCLLYRIADNCAKDVLKSGWQKLQDKRKALHEETLDEMIDVETPEKSKNQSLHDYNSKISQDLRSIVEKLPNIQQKIIWAFALAPEGEINATLLSKELNYPAGTIRQYLKRAKDTIRAEMKKRGHTYP